MSIKSEYPLLDASSRTEYPHLERRWFGIFRMKSVDVNAKVCQCVLNHCGRKVEKFWCCKPRILGYVILSVVKFFRVEEMVNVDDNEDSSPFLKFSHF